MFGPYYRPETLAEQRSRNPVPSPVQPKVSSPLAAIRTEHGRYYSNPRVREELMRLYHVRSAFPTRKAYTPIHAGSI
jgi:hypothetical protein